MQVYAHELSGPGVRADQHQVEGYRPLLSALASGNRAGVRKAVTSLVYFHTHIVRLRVIQGSAVLADVGGPYIIAPVGGELHFHGRTVGHYLLSVQDDLGYVKLETRYVGLPLVLHMGTLQLPHWKVRSPRGRRRSRTSDLSSTKALATRRSPSTRWPSRRGSCESRFWFRHLFPIGKSCTAIRLSELDRVAKLVWDRYSLLSAPSSAYVNQVRSLTGGLAYVRSSTRQLAGSTGPGPARLPAHGTVKYRGDIWRVAACPAACRGADRDLLVG